MANLSLLDLVTLQRNDPFTGMTEDVTQYAPEFSTIPVVTRAGTYYEIVKRTALPAASFRAINNGVTAGKSAFKKEAKEMFFLDTPLNVDEAIVKGQDGTAGDILSIEAVGGLQSTINAIGTQTYYGTSASSYTFGTSTSAYGFPGLRSQLSGVITAGGTTNSSSAYLVWLNPQGVHYDVGRDGEIAFSPWQRQQIAATAPGSSGNLFAWVSNISCYIGLAVISSYSVWAVVGITSGNKLTDAIAQQLVALIPLNRRNGLTWFMNRNTQYLLQSSRSAIGNFPASQYSGAPAASGPPVELCGYPIIVTDSIVNTESN